MEKTIKMKHMSTTATVLICLMLMPALAEGMGVGPSEFRIEKAIKGGEYKKTAKIFNTDATESIITVNATGEAASWVTVYAEQDLETPLETFTIPAGGNLLILMNFRIPETAANGNYTSTVYIQTAPKGTGEMAQAVSVKVPIEIAIEVIGDQILEGTVRSITTRDVEINYPLQVRIDFENTGNVKARPEIVLVIREDDEVLDSLSYQQTEIEPLARKMIDLEWDTSRSRAGNYTADVSVMLDGKAVEEKELPFNLMPIGTLTRAGSFEDLKYEGDLATGRMIKVNAVFRNTGRINTKAKFTGEVYRDGQLVNRIESDEIEVGVSMAETLTSYLKIDEPGTYTIKGNVLYEGKKTEAKELRYAVEEDAATQTTVTSTTLPKEIPAVNDKDAGGLDLIVIGGMVIIALLLAVAIRRGGKGREEKKKTHLGER